MVWREHSGQHRTACILTNWCQLLILLNSGLLLWLGFPNCWIGYCSHLFECADQWHCCQAIILLLLLFRFCSDHNILHDDRCSIKAENLPTYNLLQENAGKLQTWLVFNSLHWNNRSQLVLRLIEMYWMNWHYSLTDNYDLSLVNVFWHKFVV